MYYLLICIEPDDCMERRYLISRMAESGKHFLIDGSPVLSHNHHDPVGEPHLFSYFSNNEIWTQTWKHHPSAPRIRN